MIKNHIIVWVLAAVVLSACGAPKTPEEALRTVAEADSLWLSGRTYSDSASLAQAYTDLYRQSDTYPDEFAHACYHYGRLLRTQDDPVSAMQAFINAIHSSTTDYHILGRIYSNIGDLCHMAEEFTLSYDLFEKSANMFLRNGDTLFYYYGLNNMAFELAEQGKKEETLALLDEIETKCKNHYFLAIIQETKAEMYRLVEQYDSAICCLNIMQQMGIITPTYLTIKAQSFYRLNQTDSAILYANRVLNDSSASYQNHFNALYILSHVEDSTLTKNDIRDMDSQREDIRFYQYEPEKESLIHAIYLLRQKPSPKTNHQWLYIILCVILTGCIIIVIYSYRKRKKHQLLTQKIEVLEKKDTLTKQRMRKQIEDNCALITNSSNIKEDLCWNNYAKMCNIVNEHFYFLARKLQHTHALNETEIRLCILVLLGMSRADISQTLPYALNSIGKLKDHTAKSLGTTGKNLRDFLVKMAIEG